MTPLIGQLFALTTALCWAHNSIAYTMAGKRVGSGATTHIRLWAALPVLLVIHWIATGSPYPWQAPPMTLLYLSLSGLIGFFVADLFIFRAFLEVGPRETMVVMTLSPLFSALLSWITLGEALTLRQWGGIALTLGGIMLVILIRGEGRRARQRREAAGRGPAPALPKLPTLLKGFSWAFAGSFTQAIGMVLARAGLVPGFSPISANTLRISAGLAGLALFALARGRFVEDFRRMKDRRALAWIVSGAMIGPILGMGLSLFAMTVAPLGIVTTLMQTSPLFLLPVDRWVFKKEVPPGAVLGTILAVAGAVLLILSG